MTKPKRAKGKLIRYPRKEKCYEKLFFSDEELSSLNKIADQILKSYDKQSSVKEVK
ncbi:hypothetical protein [Campylobacter sp.]|uniref:hypothetical protein n=1 Tax=Campylobacter sp. TaxID=205 RepID=UPI002AA892B4|nr:hypothetical protein [Campylobacter sp.]MCI6660829.1 hypothetical protein [Campylobacter sp.]MCI7550295.1 hypothetical protein [Campylobacter sp.]